MLYTGKPRLARCDAGAQVEVAQVEDIKPC